MKDINFANYSTCKKKGDKLNYMTIRMDDDLIDKMDLYCKEKKINKSQFIRAIIDYSCDEIDNNEEFRNLVLSLPDQIADGKNRKKKTYGLTDEVIARLKEVKEKYRIYNVNAAINESVKTFFES